MAGRSIGRYTEGMATTIKVSEETRDRIRSFGGSTHEETIIAALDALDADEFWAQADRARAWLDRRPDVRAELDAAAADWDAAIDSDEGVLAVDRIAAIPVTRLLEQRGALTRIGAAPMRRAIAEIT